ncbi:DUF2515 family protein [Pseudomonas sp. NPDC090233]|uniref:DUF2515 family protein n=1 Tax=Pseudomonas sp. NPDC090233 TaxID=3364479 RepID=UPI00383B5709
MKEDFNLNAQACSVNDLNPGCIDLWTLGQQIATRRLCTKTRVEFKEPARYELVENFSTRAARIAGNYGKIYLELESGGKAELKGRFYWTGIAAFASKQVMCALDYSSNTKMRYTTVGYAALEATKIFLGKGNFWLFQDIFVWHWFYINYPEQFRECMCSRNWAKYNDRFKPAFDSLPWASEAPGKINNLKVTDYLAQGFSYFPKIEKNTNRDARRNQQLASLMAIANHEQIKILQPLIYESKIFKTLLNSQALVEGHFGVPRRLAAFSTACETNDPQYDIVMTEGKLHNATDRIFIGNIANKYHNLMQTQNTHMESIIRTIASWSENA